jgi:uncharacterized protein (TIGR03435 family)
MMLSIIVKASIVMMLALMGSALAGRSRASVRHLILAASFVILLLLPIAIWLAPPVELQIAPLSRAIPPGLFESSGETTSAVTVEVTANRFSDDRSIPFETIVAAIWVTGTVLLSLPIVAGLWEFRRLRRSASSWTRGTKNLDSTVDLLLHDETSGPMTLGLARPAIIFPTDAESWDNAALQRALTHELEHVRRRDYLVHLIARLACSVYWFHPLVWLSWRRLRLEAERACDDAVLRQSEATEYADQLVTIAAHMTPSARTPLLAMASRSDLKMRVAAVLDATQRRGRAGTICITIALASVLLLVGVISPLRAVTAGPQEFEVASIKKNTSGRGPYNLGAGFEPNGRFHVTNAPLFTLINIAYGLTYKQLDENGFALVNEAFDVDARAPENTVAQDVVTRRAQLRAMMQKLLADRFHLTVHKQTAETPIYALVVSKNGPRLGPAIVDTKCEVDGACPGGGGPAKGYKGRYMSVSDIAAMLTIFVDRAVVDRTAIQGRYNFNLPPWSPSPLQGATGGQIDGTEPAPDPLNPSIFEVIQEHLGLKLEATRGPFDTYVVDHVESPTEN